MTTAVLKRIPVFAMTLSLAVQQSPLERRAIAVARQIPVSTLDSALPGQTLSIWLTRIAGPDAKIKWEVSDCGEQSGDPAIDRGRDFPLCVEALVNLPGERMAIVNVVMGTFGKGLSGHPLLQPIYIREGDRLDPVPQLHDLPARIGAAR